MTKIYCDICGEEIGLAENTYIHASYLYCEKCEQIHIKNQEATCSQKRNPATIGDSAES